MAGVVEAVCPGCKQSLRIPVEWVRQPIRCKHCGLVMYARAPATAASAPVSSRTPLPPTKAGRAAPVAAPFTPSVTGSPRNALPGRAAVPAAGEAFANLEDGAPDGPAPARHHVSAGGWWKGPIIGGCILLVAAVATAVLWPQLQKMASSQRADAERAGADSRDKDEPARPNIDPPKDRDKSTGKDKPKDGDKPKDSGKPKDGVKPKDGDKPKDGSKPSDSSNPKDGTKPKDSNKPKDSDKPKDSNKPKDGGKPKDPPKGTGAFPRRALAVSVNNYLFANPINYGIPLANAHNLKTLLDRFTTGLKIPRDQIFELSDAAMVKPQAPVKDVMEKTISDFLAGSRPQDRIVLLLICHSVEIGDEVYLAPLAGDLSAKETLIPLSWLYEKLASCPARQKVLILDTCRLNPARGMERPGGEPMGAKLDAKLKSPPPGVQVWSVCGAGQQSYEFENGEINNGVFTECLFEALARGVEGKIQRPDQPIPLEPLVEKVNARMKAELAQLKKEQQSRLSGKEAEGGAAYDPKQPPAPKPVIRPSAGPDGGRASIDQVRAILREVDVPPVKVTRDEMLLRAESMPPFSATALEAYKADDDMTPFREAIVKARTVLNEQLKGKRLREEWQLSGTENQFKEMVKSYQEKEVAGVTRELEETLDDLKRAGKERAKDKSKRWQANYDYILARLEAQIAYLYEYNSLLGAMRKELPERGPNGWRLASQEKLQGDNTGKKLAKESAELLKKLAKNHPGTPWELLAKRDRLTTLGLEWKPNK
jgi:hypothetical protein